jgi:hypothetical protein
MLVHRSLEIVEHTVDAQKPLIEMPGVARLRAAALKLAGELRTKLAAPAPDALVRDGDARSARISPTSPKLKLNA